jgi:2-polyprenyl-3-methyl-5-hydroxy-6-metoxy-1,4-benzoquinol methylase
MIAKVAAKDLSRSQEIAACSVPTGQRHVRPCKPEPAATSVQRIAMADHPPGFFQGTEMPTAGWWEALWPDPADVLGKIGLRAGMDVIDLCSGDGWFTLQIAKVAHHVTAIDIDGHLLEVAQHRLMENGVTNCAFVAGDACDVAKLVKPSDFVFMANVFHGVPDRRRLAEAIQRTLKADAQFAIINWHKRPREQTTILGEPRGPKTELRISPEETIKSVEDGGLKCTKIVELPPYHYGVVFQRFDT